MKIDKVRAKIRKTGFEFKRLQELVRILEKQPDYFSLKNKIKRFLGV